jgi:hypothetical protein
LINVAFWKSGRIGPPISASRQPDANVMMTVLGLAPRDRRVMSLSHVISDQAPDRAMRQESLNRHVI